jgi:hypothetical protein
MASPSVRQFLLFITGGGVVRQGVRDEEDEPLQPRQPSGQQGMAAVAVFREQLSRHSVRAVIQTIAGLCRGGGDRS